MRIRTVLCPIDFSSLDDPEIGVAREVCLAFGAKLLLHHNLAAAEPGFSRAWEWSKAHEGRDGQIPDAERRLQRLVERLRPDVAAEAAITTGPVGQVVLSLIDGVGPDLVVLGSHGWSTQDHASVTERVIRESRCPVLTFREGGGRGHGFRLRDVPGAPVPRAVVATDLTHESNATVAYAMKLARALPLQVDLLHVLATERRDDAVAVASAALDAHVPPDLVDRIRAHVRIGQPAETIVEYVDEAMPSFLVIGSHAHGLLRRLLTRDTTQAVVRDVGCPVWVVPSGAPA